MPGIEFGLSAPVTIVLVCISAATAIAFLYYRTTLPPLPRSRKTLLPVLRSLTLCTLALLIFQPLLHIFLYSHDAPVLAILVDNSRSMRLVDAQGSRAQTLRSLVTQLRFPKSKAATRFYTFGVRPHPATGLPSDTLPLDEDATDIAAAIQEIGTAKQAQNIQAVLLMTDGVYTLGQNPLYDGERLGIPCYTVGIGDSAEPKDVSIAHIAANEIAFRGVRTPVDATIRSSGFGGEHLQVTLAGEGKELDRAPLTLHEGTREYIVRLSYLPETEGEKRLTVAVPVLHQEVTEKNNRRTFTIRVLKSALHVLLLAGSPGPDVSVIRQTVVEEPNLTVQSFTQKPGGGFYEGDLSEGIADSADCLLLIDMPTAGTPPSTLEQIRRLIIDRTVPLLYVSGHNVDPSGLSRIAGELPFGFTPAGAGEEGISVTPDLSQKGNALLEPGGGVSFESWSRLPPIYRMTGTYQAKPEATVLTTSTTQQGTAGGPLMLTRSAANHKSLAIAGYGVWRWRLMAQGDPATEQLLPAFLRAAVLWLTTPADLRRFSVSPVQETYPVGEPVEFTGRLSSATAQPIDDANVRIVLRAGSQVAECDLRPLGDGRYAGTVEGLAEGMYSYRGTAEWRGGTVGVDTGSVAVGGLDLEFRDPRMNIGLLRQLAYRTGGISFSPPDLSRLDSALSAQKSFAGVEKSRTIDVELWNWRSILALLIALFAAEWLLRKWYGML